MRAGATTGLSTAAANLTLLAGRRSRISRAVDQVDGSRLPIEAVADPPHGHDLKGRSRSELLAQPADVHVDGLAVAGELPAPHVLQQRVTCVDATREREQVRDEVELTRRQLDVGAVEDHTPSRAVDAERADRVELRDGFGL